MIRSSIFVKLSTQPAEEIQIQLKLSILNSNGKTFYINFKSLKLMPYEYNQWVEIGGDKLVQLENYNWEETTRLRIYLEISDPTIEYKDRKKIDK
jgi:hypothetical protein